MRDMGRIKSIDAFLNGLNIQLADKLKNKKFVHDNYVQKVVLNYFENFEHCVVKIVRSSIVVYIYEVKAIVFRTKKRLVHDKMTVERVSLDEIILNGHTPDSTSRDLITHAKNIMKKKLDL